MEENDWEDLKKRWHKAEQATQPNFPDKKTTTVMPQHKYTLERIFMYDSYV